MSAFQGWKRLTGRHVYLDGYNGAVGNAYEDLWDFSAIWTPTVAAGVTFEVASSAVADDVGSTGATSLKILGLDTAGKFQESTVVMDGRTVVAVATTYWRILAAEVMAAGTTGYNEGVISVADAVTTWTNGTADTASAVKATIAIGQNRTHLGRFTAPAGRSYFLKDITLGCNTQAVTFAVQLREYGDIWKTMGFFNLAATTNAIWIPVGENFCEVPPMADFRFNVTCGAGGGVAMAIAHLEMV